MCIKTHSAVGANRDERKMYLEERGEKSIRLQMTSPSLKLQMLLYSRCTEDKILVDENCDRRQMGRHQSSRFEQDNN